MNYLSYIMVDYSRLVVGKRQIRSFVIYFTITIFFLGILTLFFRGWFWKTERVHEELVNSDDYGILFTVGIIFKIYILPSS